MKKIVICVSSLMIFCIMLFGCKENFYFGTTETGFEHFPKKNSISAKKAVELAQPYLAHSYELRKNNLTRKYTISHTPFESIILKGDFYYVTREDEPNKFVNFYIPYAVKVNKNTGEVTKPDEKTDKVRSGRDARYSQFQGGNDDH